MHSTLKLRESDPHDIFAIEPEVVPVAWADKVLADIKRDANSAASDQPPQPASSVAAPPMLDTTFRAIAADDIHVPDIHVPSDLAADRPPTGKWAKSVVMLVFAVCSAAVAAAWQQHGDAAKQTIASWTPTFALTSSPTPETTTGQSEPPAVQTSAADPTPPQPAAPAQLPASAAPAAAAPSPDTAQLVQSMGRDLAAMGQQIEQLKTSIAELKAGQQQAMARDVAKPAEVRTSVANPRSKMSAPPPRSAATPRRPMPAYAPVQAAAPAPLPQPALPQTAPTYASPQPAPQAVDHYDEPVVRPPMPLR